VQHALPSSIAAWGSFYVIVGSSAGALTGLQFVVMAFVADGRRRLTTGEIDTFATPAIVHFCTALMVAAVLSAPWQALSGPALVIGICGAVGMGYCGIVTRRAHRQTAYQLVMEDWIWYTALPLVAYAMLFFAALVLVRHATPALFTVAAASLALLFIGIHSAWDTVTYVAIERAKAREVGTE
jgi:hypothetical protein